MTAENAAPEPGRRRKPLWFTLGLIALVLVAAIAIIAKVKDMNTPPESAYTQAEAYEPMEAAAADAVAALPEFPGFEQRTWAELPCSHNGEDDPDYTNIEIRYQISDENSGVERVRTEYVDLLRDHWSSLGYEITFDETKEKSNGRTDRNLAVQRDDGITLWYRVWGGVSLLIQSGCVPVSDVADFEYVPPTGGIEPGGMGDNVSDYFPEGIPSEEESDEAIAPFAENQAALVPFSSPGSFEGHL